MHTSHDEKHRTLCTLWETRHPYAEGHSVSETFGVAFEKNFSKCIHNLGLLALNDPILLRLSPVFRSCLTQREIDDAGWAHLWNLQIPIYWSYSNTLENSYKKSEEWLLPCESMSCARSARVRGVALSIEVRCAIQSVSWTFEPRTFAAHFGAVCMAALWFSVPIPLYIFAEPVLARFEWSSPFRQVPSALWLYPATCALVRVLYADEGCVQRHECVDSPRVWKWDFPKTTPDRIAVHGCDLRK